MINNYRLFEQQGIKKKLFCFIFCFFVLHIDNNMSKYRVSLLQMSGFTFLSIECVVGEHS